jgi:hypothetical protein
MMEYFYGEILGYALEESTANKINTHLEMLKVVHKEKLNLPEGIEKYYIKNEKP